MIFEHRNIDEISDDEFNQLIEEHYAEKRHLEFKLTINLKDDDDKVEILRDITSMANSGGGFIIVGIRDDGKGRAQRFEPTMVGNVTSIAQSVRALCLDGIQDRIEGMDIQTRQIGENPIVVIRVPSSTRLPHMICYQQRAEFYSRYQDGKRTMSMAEIRELFSRDETIRRLKFMEEKFNQLTSHASAETQASDDVALLAKQEAAELHKARLAQKFATVGEATFPEGISGEMAQDIYYETFKKRFGKKPALWLSATPVDFKDNVLDPFNLEIVNLLVTLPGSRNSGWNMGRTISKLSRLSKKIVRGDNDYGEISLDSYGHLEFWTHLDNNFCDFQPENEFKERPRLYPYPVTENPVTFLRLYRAIIDHTENTCDVLITMRWNHLKGYVLPPHSPNALSWGFKDLHSEPFQQDHLEPTAMRVPYDFDPDAIALELLESFYKRNGLQSTDVPFWDQHKGKFVW